MPSEHESALTAFIKSKGFKMTAQRKEIVEHIVKHCAHVCPDELFLQLRAIYPRIGRATVYRTLKLLREANIAQQVDFGDGRMRIEPTLNKPHHDHLICTGCGSSIEFLEPRIEKMQDHIAESNDFLPHHHRLEIYGLCKVCRNATRKDETHAAE